MPLMFDDLEPVRDALRQMAWDLDLGRPVEPVPPDGEGVDAGRGREARSETVLEIRNEIDDLTNLLADHAISTILLEANLGADLNAARSSGLIEHARITFATEEGETAPYEPLSGDAAKERVAVTTSLLRNLARLRAECGVNESLEGHESPLRPPWLGPDTLPEAIAYLCRHSTLGNDIPTEQSWADHASVWEAWR